MPNFALPQIPQMVVPTGIDPKSVISAAAATEENVVGALLQGPLSAMGLTLPKLPGPAGIMAQMAAGLPDLPSPPGLPGATTIGPKSTAAPNNSNKVRTWKIGI